MHHVEHLVRAVNVVGKTRIMSTKQLGSLWEVGGFSLVSNMAEAVSPTGKRLHLLEGYTRQETKDSCEDHRFVLCGWFKWKNHLQKPDSTFKLPLPIAVPDKLDSYQ